jgi:hypothetical protein
LWLAAAAAVAMPTATRVEQHPPQTMAEPLEVTAHPEIQAVAVDLPEMDKMALPMVDNLSPMEVKVVPTQATTTKVDMEEAALDGAKVVVVVDTTAEMEAPPEIWGALAAEVLMPALILKMLPDSKLEMDKLLSPGK